MEIWKGIGKSCQLRDKFQDNWREIVFKNDKSQTSGPLPNVKIKSKHHCYMLRICNTKQKQMKTCSTWGYDSKFKTFLIDFSTFSGG